MATIAGAPAASRTSLRRQMTWWVLALPVLLIVALAAGNLYLLNGVHVLSGVLWTGGDIFMGFIVAAVLRRLEPPQRAAVIAALVPRTILYFPTVSLTTTAAGWVLALRFGFFDAASPQHRLLLIALAVVAVLTVQGLGVLLPNAIRMYRELHSANPDRERIGRLARINFNVAASQGVLQLAIVLVMAAFVVR